MKLKKIISILTLLLCGIHTQIYAQSVSVGEKEFDAHPSAIIEIRSATKGVLIPRLSAFQRSVVRVDSLSVGLLIYQTDEQSGFYYYDGVEWKHLAGGGNSGNDGIPNNLSYVAFTGDYADLLNKPLLFSGKYADLTGIPATFDSNYYALKNLPKIGDSILVLREEVMNVLSSKVNNSDPRLSDARSANDVYWWAKQPNKPNYTPGEIGAATADHRHRNADLTEWLNLAVVATSGNYHDLLNRPNVKDSVLKYAVDADISMDYNTLYNIPATFDSNYFALKNLPNIEDSVTKYGFDADYRKLKNVPTEFVAKSHTHTQTDITNFEHTHTTANITDFAHTHTKANITDFSHTHTNVDLPAYPTLESLNGVANNDPRLSNARTASDVYDWAKQPNKPVYTHSEVGAAPTSHSHKDIEDKVSYNSDNIFWIFNDVLPQIFWSKADTSHGNHVPKAETANNTRFLRNDNTWQNITPKNIGAVSLETFGNFMFFAHTSQGTGDGSNWANAKAFSVDAYEAMPTNTAALLLGDGTKKYILTRELFVWENKPLYGGFIGNGLLTEKAFANPTFSKFATIFTISEEYSLNHALIVLALNAYANNIVVANTSVQHDFTSSLGAGFFLFDNSAVTDCIAINCENHHGEGAGAGFYIAGSGCILKNCVADSCFANVYGGGFYTHSNALHSSLINCSAMNCLSGEVSGGFHIEDRYTDCFSCIAKNCKSFGEYGGGFSIPYSHEGILADCSAIDCFGGKGGGFYMGGQYSTLHNCTADGCKATSGSAFYLRYYYSADLQNCNAFFCTGAPPINQMGSNAPKLKRRLGNEYE